MGRCKLQYNCDTLVLVLPQSSAKHTAKFWQMQEISLRDLYNIGFATNIMFPTPILLLSQ